MEQPDVRSIASLSLDQRAQLERRLLERGAVPAGTGRIPPRTGEGPWPLSFAQQRLWFIHQLEPDSAAYNEPTALRCTGPLDLNALRRALDLIVERHESLRTTFTMVADGPAQAVGPARRVTLPLVNLVAEPDTERAARLERVLRDEARRPFDLGADLMLRVLLVRLSDREHVVLLTLHHIASDAWSVGLLARELAAAYAAFSTGTTPTLAPLPIQYADYAVWQRERLRDAALDGQLAYWRRQLEGVAPLELPTDRPRPSAQSHRGALRVRLLPARLAEALRALSRQERVTLFMTLLASFHALLHRYSGQGDVAIGSVIGGRTRIETEPLIGFFVNTLVMRGDCAGDPSFSELLGRTRVLVLGAFEHQDLPFERLVEELRPPRSLARAPLFQVMFVVQDGTRTLPGLPGLDVRPLPVDCGSAQFDLSLSVTDTAAGLRARAEYATDLFDAATIDRLLEHWEVLLEGIVADPARRLSELPLVTAAEHEQIVSEWAGGRGTFDAEATLPELFEAQAARTPDAPAVTFEEVTLDYRELNRRANRLARRLRARGVSSGSRVGICLDRSLDLVVAILGALKAGAAYVPLDPAYPGSRLRFMLEDAGASAVVTVVAFAERLGVPGLPTLLVDADPAEIAGESGDDRSGGAAPGDLAHVIYTSGSTGTPKGVGTTHANVVRLFQATAPWAAFSPADVWTLFHSVAFDFSVWELWGALLHGGRLVVVPYLVSRSPDAFRELVRAEGVTVLNQTPSAFRPFIRADATAGDDGLALRLIVLGGEVLDFASLRTWMDRHGDDHPMLVNIYGPTETTVLVTYHRVTVEEVRDPRGSVIGRALADLSVHVLDGHGQHVPIGAAGELFVGGAGLARGYLGRPELTAERFVSDPFGATPGGRLYRTGDLVRFRADGVLEFLGRLDDQIKIRGYRIELGEIEAACLAHPSVREAIVAVREDAAGERRLVAYIVAADGTALGRSALRTFLGERLPEHMLPAAVVTIPRVPLTPNGKVDRRALPAPEPAASGPDTGAAPPTSPLEHQLVEIWEALLDVRPIGIRDDFFDLGGHSLLATRMIDAVARACERRLPVATLFEEATIEHVARALLRAEAESFRSRVTAFNGDGGRRPLFFLHGDFKGGGFYVRDLARQLGADRPFYALHPHGLDGGPIPPSIEAMADDFLAVVRGIQPHGPYLLGGHCNGGLVAFEMARRIVADGGTVALVVVVDAAAWNRRFRRLRWAVDRIERLPGVPFAAPGDRFLKLRARVLAVEAHASDYRRRFAALAALRPRPRLAVLLKKAGAAVAELARGGRPREAPGLTVPEGHARAVDAYVPGPYAGRLALLAAAERRSEAGDLGWRRVADHVEIHVLPGDHLTTLTRHSHALGAQLRACVESVETA